MGLMDRGDLKRENPNVLIALRLKLNNEGGPAFIELYYLAQLSLDVRIFSQTRARPFQLGQGN